MIRRLIVFAIVVLCLFSAHPAFAKSQDIVKMNTDIDVSNDMVVNDVVAIGGNVVVSGKVESNIVAIAGSVTLKPKSYVGGQIVVVGGELIKDPYSQIIGKTTQVYLPYFIPSVTSLLKGGWITVWATVSLLMLLGFLGLTVLLVALIPEQMGTVVNLLERSFFTMLLWGMVWVILIVPIALFLAISIIGIALIPLEVLLVVLALVIGYIAAAIFVGKNILLSFKKISPPFIDAMLGILILFCVGFIPIIGPIVKVLFLIAGFGAVIITRFGTIK